MDGRSADDATAGGSRSVRAVGGHALGIVWLPDLAAAVAGATGAVALDGLPRGLCAAGCAVALVGFGLRFHPSARARRVGVLRSVIASLPALLLLTAVVHRAPRSESGLFASAPPPPAIRLDEAPPAARDCLASEARQAYLDALYRHLDEIWAARSDSDEGGFVVLGFILDAEGGVRLSRVIDQSSETYRTLGTEALTQAAPFGPLRGELACLAQIELRATLDRTSVR